MDLADALGLDGRELVAFVGAGGKKTAMARLVAEAGGRGLTAGYTATANTPPPEYPLVLAAPGDLLDALDGRDSPVAFARERVDRPERVEEKLAGFPPDAVDRVFEAGRFDWLLVKADGARMREFKAPGADEPPVPGASTAVVPVASVRVVGEPLTDDLVHRVGRVRAITGLERGDEIRPADVAAVLASDRGGLKNVPQGARVVPVVNKADTPPLRGRARAVLDAVLARTDRVDRGLVTSFREGVVETVAGGGSA